MDLQWDIFCDHSGSLIFEWIFLILADNNDTYTSINELDYPLQKPPITELSALERLKYSCIML